MQPGKGAPAFTPNFAASCLTLSFATPATTETVGAVITEECRGDGVKPAHRGGSLLAALAPEPSPPLERREAPPQD